MTLARFSERLDADRSGRSHVLLGIVDLAGQARLGAVLLNAIDWTAHTAVTDLALADERWWTDGHAEEAWALLLDHSFTALGLRKVRTTACAPLATRIAVVEKLGFRLEGTYRAEALVDGEYVDVLAFGLFANEFRAARAGSSQP